MAAPLLFMTIIVNRVSKGQPISGQFSAKNNDESAVELDIQFGDVVQTVSEEKSRALVESSIVEIDRAWLDEASADSEIENAAAAGTAHAHAELIAYVNSDNLQDYDYEARGEALLNDRRAGFLFEQEKGYSGPGELTAMKRQLIVNYCRKRADEIFEKAANEPIGDAAAHMFARSETFSEIALDISAPNAFYSGE
jgi:hypothetical protein